MVEVVVVVVDVVVVVEVVVVVLITLSAPPQLISNIKAAKNTNATNPPTMNFLISQNIQLKRKKVNYLDTIFHPKAKISFEPITL